MGYDEGDAGLVKQIRAYLAQLPGVVKTLSESPCSPVVLAAVLKMLVADKENRPWVVKHGGVALLLRLSEVDDAKQALAQICIVANPTVFTYKEAMTMLLVVLGLLEHSHELLQFEGAMALTNLVTRGPEFVDRAVGGEGWRLLRDLIGGDEGNPMLAKAGLEGMNNLCSSPVIRERMNAGLLNTDLEIMLAYVRCDDPATACVAAGAVAMLMDDLAPQICKVRGFRNMVFALVEEDPALVHRAAFGLHFAVLQEVGGDDLLPLLHTVLADQPPPAHDLLSALPPAAKEPSLVQRVVEESKFRATLGRCRHVLSPSELAALEDETVSILDRTQRMLHIVTQHPELDG